MTSFINKIFTFIGTRIMMVFFGIIIVIMGIISPNRAIYATYFSLREILNK